MNNKYTQHWVRKLLSLGTGGRSALHTDWPKISDSPRTVMAEAEKSGDAHRLAGKQTQFCQLNLFE